MCKLKCFEVFSANDRVEIHSYFWNLSDTKKLNFYTQNIERWDCKRKSKSSGIEKPKECVYKYHFEKNDVRSRVIFSKNFRYQ